jgi:hypothetical protein
MASVRIEGRRHYSDASAFNSGRRLSQGGNVVGETHIQLEPVAAGEGSLDSIGVVREITELINTEQSGAGVVGELAAVLRSETGPAHRSINIFDEFTELRLVGRKAHKEIP